MKYLALDGTFVNSSVDAELPAGAMLLNDDQWNDRFAIRVDEKQDELIAKVKTHRNNLRFEGGVNVDGHWFQSDSVAVGEYTALILLSASAPAGYVLRNGWRTMQDGVIVDMTAGLVKKIVAQGFAQVALIDDAAQAHIRAIEAITNVDELDQYDIHSGWPATFE